MLGPRGQPSITHCAEEKFHQQHDKFKFQVMTFSSYAFWQARLMVSLACGSDYNFLLLFFAVPSAPLNFDLRQSTSSSLLASWDVPATRNGIIQGYTVSCNATPMATPITFDAPSDTLVLNLTSLLPFTNYTCSVTANTSAGAGLASNLDLERTNEGGG